MPKEPKEPILLTNTDVTAAPPALIRVGQRIVYGQFGNNGIAYNRPIYCKFTIPGRQLGPPITY
jgi:hypothetical protein